MKDLRAFIIHDTSVNISDLPCWAISIYVFTFPQGAAQGMPNVVGAALR